MSTPPSDAISAIFPLKQPTPAEKLVPRPPTPPKEGSPPWPTDRRTKPEPHTTPIRKPLDYVTRVVVIALDSSKNSDIAFHWALTNLLDPARDLAVLVNVRAAPMVPGALGGVYMDFSGTEKERGAVTDYLLQFEEKFRTEAHQLLQYYASQVKKRGVAVKAIAMRGDARDEILRKTTELNADALVLGCRGLGAIRRYSTCNYLIHHAKCPVIIIKDPVPTNPPPTPSPSPAATAAPVPPTPTSTP
ncbi:hypothetical protein HK104_007369, partial [Borealophlyctis nickersoniae]